MNLIQALYDPSIQLPTDVHFYQHRLKDIEYFGIQSQVYYLLKQQGKLEQTSAFFQKSLCQKYKSSLYQNIFIKNQTDQILHALEANKIDVIPLKGVTFAEKYFGHIGARGTSDIDLLIKKSDLKMAMKNVKMLGFTVEQKPIPSHFHCSFSKELPDSPIPLTVELHWDILKENTANFHIDEFWNEAAPVKNAKHIKELSNYHTFYMICLHGWRHNLDSLKYFIDIIQMIHLLHHELDYYRLFRDADSHKTLKRMIRTLSIVYNQFPHLDSVKEFRNKRSNLYWNYDAFTYVKKKTFKNYMDFIDYQFLSYDSIKHSMIEVFNWITPLNQK